MRIIYKLTFLSMIAGLLLSACKESAIKEDSTMQEVIQDPMDWVKNANIYEVNVRQYTPEGTFKAFKTHLPRLKQMGVDVLWFMPIYPISKERRKGGLGSYYSIADYTGINPKFGTMTDFKAVVDEAHALGMKVILDWVANHTGWDHPWVKNHPEWYTKNDKGEITDPLNIDGVPVGWTDVADLDYSNMDMRKAQIEAMQFWVRELNVDGFRCDVAYEVPEDFWVSVKSQLDSIRPVFMLAESEMPAHRDQESFHATYGWSLHHLMNAIAKGEKTPEEISEWLKEDRKKFSKGFNMHFITNHDENAWQGSEFERMGDGVETFAVLAHTFDGIPLIYSGQEGALSKRLSFFEKDTIQWNGFPKATFYATLLNLKHQNPALWNGSLGGEPRIISNSNEKAVFSFMREKDDARVVVVLNLTGEPQEVSLGGNDYQGDYTNVFANRSITLTPDMIFQLNPWDYLVLAQ